MQFTPDSIEKLIAVCTFLGGAVAWYRSSVIAQIEAKRDFNHLRRNQEQLVQNLELLCKENERALEEIKLELLEIRAFLYGRLNRRKEDE